MNAVVTSEARLGAREVSLAAVAAILVQAAVVLALVVTSRAPQTSDAAALVPPSPVAIAVNMLPRLKLGSENPAAASTPPTRSDVQAQPIKPAPAHPAAPPPRKNVQNTPMATRGATAGSDDGTEVDPLKARAVDTYRAQLAGWFASHFSIRGKVPFDTLRTLQARVVVTTAERHVTGFSVTQPSGNDVFDEDVRTTLSSLQASGVELPAPPPAYPELLAESVPLTFRCTVKSQCE